ncbi:hypothetical protein CAOG_05386 [Capsaspora owczarzaki ATCC 30864]|uniref:Uncharacterized protein n=1 Tax=Capsaspora owczarzaki (strain ATCC 30864) TaxID=595528 RepID=A0A0D2X3S3_CAPO3|nr:hypothetical protein CAOG_05386 [Capsaspora owczarzaki ATCC 30864]KJE94809.1 hypothetical protein CAOG_005386 [Capsaspora owczarzaki ATCC 30864]|eukprot:XP_004347071.1 hypothetical protein CAOG_05386 [Capsaspora owczarzaki ATCC 30864]
MSAALSTAPQMPISPSKSDLEYQLKLLCQLHETTFQQAQIQRAIHVCAHLQSPTLRSISPPHKPACHAHPVSPLPISLSSAVTTTTARVLSSPSAEPPSAISPASSMPSSPAALRRYPRTRSAPITAGPSSSAAAVAADAFAGGATLQSNPSNAPSGQTTPSSNLPCDRILSRLREAQIYAEIAMHLKTWSVFDARNALTEAADASLGDFERDERLCRLIHELRNTCTSRGLPATMSRFVALDTETASAIDKMGTLYTQWWKSAWSTSRADILETLLTDVFVAVHSRYAHLIRSPQHRLQQHHAAAPAPIESSTLIVQPSSTVAPVRGGGHHRNRSCSMPDVVVESQPVPASSSQLADTLPFHSAALRSLFLGWKPASPSAPINVSSAISSTPVKVPGRICLVMKKPMLQAASGRTGEVATST